MASIHPERSPTGPGHTEPAAIPLEEDKLVMAKLTEDLTKEGYREASVHLVPNDDFLVVNVITRKPPAGLDRRRLDPVSSAQDLLQQVDCNILKYSLGCVEATSDGQLPDITMVSGVASTALELVDDVRGVYKTWSSDPGLSDVASVGNPPRRDASAPQQPPVVDDEDGRKTPRRPVADGTAAGGVLVAHHPPDHGSDRQEESPVDDDDGDDEEVPVPPPADMMISVSLDEEGAQARHVQRIAKLSSYNDGRPFVKAEQAVIKGKGGTSSESRGNMHVLTMAEQVGPQYRYFMELQRHPGTSQADRSYIMQEKERIIDDLSSVLGAKGARYPGRTETKVRQELQTKVREYLRRRSPIKRNNRLARVRAKQGSKRPKTGG